MDKTDKKIIISLLILVILVLIAGIFVRNIESKKEAISFTPAKTEMNFDDNSKKDKDKVESEKNNDEKDNTEKEPDNIIDQSEDLNNEIFEEENIEGVIFTPENIRTQLYATVNLNLRRGPGPEFDVVSSLATGDEATLLAKGNNGWYKLIVDDLEVYADGNYLSEVDSR